MAAFNITFFSDHEETKNEAAQIIVRARMHAVGCFCA